MVEWHHQLDGHELEQALGVGDGQGSLACCGPQARKESDLTVRGVLQARTLEWVAISFSRASSQPRD